MSDTTITVTLTEDEASEALRNWKHITTGRDHHLNNAKHRIADAIEEARRIPEPPWGSIVVAGRLGLEMRDDLSRRQWIRTAFGGAYHWSDSVGNNAKWEELINPELVRGR